MNDLVKNLMAGGGLGWPGGGLGVALGWPGGGLGVARGWSATILLSGTYPGINEKLSGISGWLGLGWGLLGLAGWGWLAGAGWGWLDHLVKNIIM